MAIGYFKVRLHALKRLNMPFSSQVQTFVGRLPACCLKQLCSKLFNAVTGFGRQKNIMAWMRLTTQLS